MFTLLETQILQLCKRLAETAQKILFQLGRAFTPHAASEMQHEGLWLPSSVTSSFLPSGEQLRTFHIFQVQLLPSTL